MARKFSRFKFDRERLGASKARSIKRKHDKQDKFDRSLFLKPDIMMKNDDKLKIYLYRACQK